MYTILVTDSNELVTTVSERIIRKSSLVDCLHFLVNPLYKNSINMRDFNVRLDYILPISQDHYYVDLSLSRSLYKGMLEYKVPFDNNLTKEAGDLKVWLTFTFIERDRYGNQRQFVRHTTPTTIPIFNCENNGDIIPQNPVATNREVDDAFDGMLHHAFGDGDEPPCEHRPHLPLATNEEVDDAFNRMVRKRKHKKGSKSDEESEDSGDLEDEDTEGFDDTESDDSDSGDTQPFASSAWYNGLDFGKEGNGAVVEI